ncbi:hypothetical protein [Cellulomonas hominis]|uniref:hypothetical protein n=1 Tax=Cellulomonas hominis TaxID=156981 RepID=UPI001BCC8221|nr:hypothetical protein [Cellulomonas hominis]
MATQISFDDVVSTLRGGGFVGSSLDTFRVREPRDFFAGPTLVVKDDLGDLTADVILVSARGAAGKSTAAEQMSFELGAPLWKLEEDSAVGATSLAHLLSRYTNRLDYESTFQQLSRPQILIDSLDEAHARVSGTSWSQFLDSMGEVVRHGARLVLFGRERTLEEVWVSLDDAGASVAWLEVSHFDAQSRLDYVDGLTRLRAKNPAVVDTEAYVEARDAILAGLTGPLPDEAVDAFVGYAPVLDAVSVALRADVNLYALAREFETTSGGTRHLDVLRGILEALLHREQKKVAPLAESLGLDPQAVYTPDEQMDWLCATLEGLDFPAVAHVESKVRAEYLTQIEPFRAQHPFLNEGDWASAVFRAYVAYRRFSLLPGERLLRTGNDSSLLFDLFSLDREGALVDEWQFAALHASVTAGESTAASATVSITESGPSQFDVTLRVDGHGAKSAVDLVLISSHETDIRLLGPLEGLTVETSRGVLIPAHLPSTVLGPDLFLRCGSLRIEGGSVEFAQRAAPASGSAPVSGMVTFDVLSGLELPAEITRPPRAGDFELIPPGGTSPAFPWHSYVQSREEVSSVDPSSRAVRFLKMLMNLTRSHGHDGERGTYVMKLQGRQSIKGEDFGNVLELLEARGTIRTSGDIVYLTEQWEQHRFSGKTLEGRRLIEDVWDVWGPVADLISSSLKGR